MLMLIRILLILILMLMLWPLQSEHANVLWTAIFHFNFGHISIFSFDFPEMTFSVYGRNLMTITLEQVVPVTHQILSTLFPQQCLSKMLMKTKRDCGDVGLRPHDTIATKKNASIPLHICGWMKIVGNFWPQNLPKKIVLRQPSEELLDAPC